MMTLIQSGQVRTIHPGEMVKINVFGRKEAQQSGFNPQTATPITKKVYEATTRGALSYRIPSEKFPKRIDPKRQKTIRLDVDTKLIIRPSRRYPLPLPPYDAAV